LKALQEQGSGELLAPGEPTAREEEPAQADLSTPEVPAATDELAATEAPAPAAPIQLARIRILPPKPPRQPTEDEDVEMVADEPAKVSMLYFSFHFLNVLKDPLAPPQA
jgi:hypothetical protein